MEAALATDLSATSIFDVLAVLAHDWNLPHRLLLQHFLAFHTLPTYLSLALFASVTTLRSWL